jgi:hypothetical protein
MCGRVTSFLKVLYEFLVNKEQFLTEDMSTVYETAAYETAAYEPVDCVEGAEPVKSNRYNLRSRNRVNYAESPEFID